MSTQPADRVAPRTVVVDDSSFMRAVIAGLLREDGIDVVAEADDGARIGGGEVLLAKDGLHMVVRNDAGGRLRVALADDPPEHNVCPAVDATMRSAATIGGPLTGVVLTGMGRDGTAGIEAIAAADGRTVAQDEASSTVYGMPRRAVETGAVDTVAGIELTNAIVATISEGG